METLIVIYVGVGIIAGFIGVETEEQKKWSYGIIILSLFVSLITFGVWVIAALLEVVLGFFIGKIIKRNLGLVVGICIILGVITFIALNQNLMLNDKNEHQEYNIKSDYKSGLSLVNVCDEVLSTFDENECYRRGGTPYIDD